MDRVISRGKTFTFYEYPSENVFEKDVINHSLEIFGPKAILIDIKKRIGEDNILTIPDGYLIDFSFETDPRLYIIEDELAVHDPYKHIGQQLLKFAISYKASGRQIKSFLLDRIIRDKERKCAVEQSLAKADYRNIDAFLEDLIFEKPISAVVVIDLITSDVENVLSQLSMKTDIIEFQKYVYGSECIYKFSPFQPELRAITDSRKSRIRLEDLDTIVVPANEEGFKEVFLGRNCWYAIRISSSMIDRIRYIAGYQTGPISAITYYAEVSKVEKYKNTGKFIVYFKKRAKKIGPIRLHERKRGIAPQAPRYTTIKRLLRAKSLLDIF